MEQIIVKRPANISSQEALAHLAVEYSDAEVLSFRRVKSAGLDGDYFVATLRTALLADEPDDILIDNEDVIVEDQKHEDEEEDQMEDQDDKLDKIIELVEELVKKDEEVHNMIGQPKAAPKPQVPIAQERPPVKNPVPMQPMGKQKVADRDFVERPYTIEQYPDEETPAHPRSNGFSGSGSFCPDCLEGFNFTNDDMRSLTAAGVAWPTDPARYSHLYCDNCGGDLFPEVALENRRRRASKLFVERDADVSKKRARLELLREFGKDFKIASLKRKKKKNIFVATLIKRAGEETVVSERPPCDICGQEAQYDAKTVQGAWANLCQAHFDQMGIGLGTGKGQRLVTEADAGNTGESMDEKRKRVKEILDGNDDIDFTELEDIFGDEDPLLFITRHKRLASLRKRTILDVNDEDGTAGEKYHNWKAEQGHEPEAREPHRYEYYCDRCGEGESDEGEYCEKCEIEVAKEEAAHEREREVAKEEAAQEPDAYLDQMWEDEAVRRLGPTDY
jgi:hypothetical protein